MIMVIEQPGKMEAETVMLNIECDAAKTKSLNYQRIDKEEIKFLGLKS